MQKDSKKDNETPINVLDIKAVDQQTVKDLNVLDADFGSFNKINQNNNQNQKDIPKGKDNLMPNPDDFDEGDDEDSEGKGVRTPGL